MSWTRKINHPGEMLKKGDTVEVKILDIDQEKRRISLGIKQLTDDPWEDLAKEYLVGTEIAECEIARILDRGVVVNLSADIEGFIPLNQLGQDVNQPSRIYKVGDKTPAKVVEFDLEGRKIVLSVAEYFKDKDASLWDEYVQKFPVKAADPKAPKVKAKKDGDEDGDVGAESADAPDSSDSEAQSE
jgi:small subunit ribosomal protein S1